MRVPELTERSKGGGASKNGGSGLYVNQPAQATWEEFGMDFKIITNQDNPFLGYIDHFFPVVDPSNIPARDDGTKPTWLSAYCLASPSDQSQSRIAPLPEKIEECRSIIIPGTDIGLHDCESLTAEGNKTGQTRYMYTAIILNWTTQSIQILNMKEGRWEGLFAALQAELARLGDSLDVLNYNWRMNCEALPGAAPYKVVTGVSPIQYSNDDATEIFSKNRERWDDCQQYFNPAQTADQIRASIGAVGEQVPIAASPDEGTSTPFDSIMGQGKVQKLGDLLDG